MSHVVMAFLRSMSVYDLVCKSGAMKYIDFWLILNYFYCCIYVLQYFLDIISFSTGEQKREIKDSTDAFYSIWLPRGTSYAVISVYQAQP